MPLPLGKMSLAEIIELRPIGVRVEALYVLLGYAFWLMSPDVRDSTGPVGDDANFKQLIERHSKRRVFRYPNRVHNGRMIGNKIKHPQSKPNKTLESHHLVEAEIDLKEAIKDVLRYNGVDALSPELKRDI